MLQSPVSTGPQKPSRVAVIITACIITSREPLPAQYVTFLSPGLLFCHSARGAHWQLLHELRNRHDWLDQLLWSVKGQVFHCWGLCHICYGKLSVSLMLCVKVALQWSLSARPAAKTHLFFFFLLKYYRSACTRRACVRTLILLYIVKTLIDIRVKTLQSLCLFQTCYLTLTNCRILHLIMWKSSPQFQPAICSFMPILSASACPKSEPKFNSTQAYLIMHRKQLPKQCSSSSSVQSYSPLAVFPLLFSADWCNINEHIQDAC